MNRRQQAVVAALATAGVAGAAIGGQFVGATLFAKIEHLPETVVGIFTLHDYWEAYGDVSSVRRALKACTAVSVVIPLLPIAVACAAAMRGPRRELHGSARFASDAEIRRSGLLDAKDGQPAILVGKYQGRYLTYPGQQFVMLAAPTRSGKGVAVVIPNLLTFPDSVVVLDVKLENYGYTSAYRQKYGQQVYLWAPFDETGRTHRWNPLEKIAKSPPHLRLDRLKAISGKLYHSADGRNKFFYESARGMFEGIALFRIETGQPCTFGEILRQGTDRGNGIREHFATMRDTPGLSSDCVGALSRALSAGDEAMNNVVATFYEGLQLFSNPLVDMATSACDFEVGEVRRQRMSIYLGMPANRVSEVGLLANLFFSQLIEDNTGVLPAQDPSLKVQCLLVLDEFTAMGRVEHIDKSNAFMAGYNLRLLTINQAVAQMEPPALYGPHGTRTLVVNHGLKVVYPPRDHKEAKDVSESLGTFTEKAVSTSRSRGKSSSRSDSTSDQKRALMLAQELEAMPQEDAIILGAGRPIRCEKVYYYNDPMFVDRLKEISPSLRALGDALPTQSQLEAALNRGELCTTDVPVNDPAVWHQAREAHAHDPRGVPPLTATQLRALDAAQTSTPLADALLRAAVDDLHEMTGVRVDVDALRRDLQAGGDTPATSSRESNVLEAAAHG